MDERYIFVFMVMMSSIGFGLACRPGWHAMGSKCYLATHDLRKWGSALTMCGTFNAHLAEVHSKAVEQFLYNITISILDSKVGDFWIGLNDIQQEGTWVWNQDFSTLTADSYQNWGDGYPDNGKHDQNCCFITPRYNYWDDGHCDKEKYYICEIDSGSGTSMIG